MSTYSKSSLMKIAGMGVATAIKVQQRTAVSAGMNAQIASLSQSVQQALSESGELASLMNDSEMKELVKNEINDAVYQELTAPDDQKTNLDEEEAKPKAHKVSEEIFLVTTLQKKHHKKHHKHSKTHDDAPA